MWQDDDESNYSEPIRVYQPIQGPPRKNQTAKKDSHIGGHATDSCNAPPPTCSKCSGNMYLLSQLVLPNFVRDDDSVVDRTFCVHACPRAACFDGLSFSNGFSNGGQGVLICQRTIERKDLPAPPTPVAPVKSSWYSDDPEQKNDEDDNEWEVSDGNGKGNIDLEKAIADMEITGVKKEAGSKQQSKAKGDSIALPYAAFDCFGLRQTIEPPAPRQQVDEDDVGLSSSDDKIRNMLARYMAEEDDQEILSALKGTEMGSSAGGGKGSGELDERLSEKDRILLGFQDRMKRVPRQVIRCARNGAPLWSIPSQVQSDGEPILHYSVPQCACGTKRVFEFQLLPSLLHVLSVDKHSGTESSKINSMLSSGMNWGSIAVYSCPHACDSCSEEFLVVQAGVDDVPTTDGAEAADNDDLAPATLAVMEDLDDDDEFEPDA